MMQVTLEVDLHHGVFAMFSKAKPSQAPPIATRIQEIGLWFGQGDERMDGRRAGLLPHLGASQHPTANEFV